jgi:cytochrome c-type biogenesis protein CcmH
MKRMVLFVLILVANINQSYAEQESIFIGSDKQIVESVELFEFESPQQQSRAIQLAKTLRCPQCQNQNLIESNSPIAKDLRLIVYQQITSGKTDQEVIDYMVERFGDYVLYNPPLSKHTWILWFGPFLIFVSALFWVVIKSLRNS